MSVQSAMSLGRMAFLFFLAESPLALVLARFYPDSVVAIVLVAAPIIGAAVGMVLARALRRGLEDAFAENFRKAERYFVLAAAASLLGAIPASLGRGDVGIPGLVVSAGGMLAAYVLLLKAAPPGGRPGARFPSTADPGRLE